MTIKWTGSYIDWFTLLKLHNNELKSTVSRNSLRFFNSIFAKKKKTFIMYSRIVNMMPEIFVYRWNMYFYKFLYVDLYFYLYSWIHANFFFNFCFGCFANTDFQNLLIWWLLYITNCPKRVVLEINPIFEIHELRNTFFRYKQHLGEMTKKLNQK